ncbi:MAG: alpha-2-macroglobulin family protein [Anaerolineae bacterium]
MAYLAERIWTGEQFVFANADAGHPIALQVDDAVRVLSAPAILSRHAQAIHFGDQPAAEYKQGERMPLPDLPRLATPRLHLLTVITDRKIYKPGQDALIYVIAPEAAGKEAALKVRLAGQKVYEASIPLNANGLALHRYPELKEGEYEVQVRLGEESEAGCDFSVAEFSLSPLVVTLQEHTFEKQHLRFAVKVLLLSQPYSGPAEFGLQCQVCGERVVATQTAKVKNGAAHGDFDLSGHGGPFHVQVTTPAGHTALVSFPGTGVMEREHIRINPLGQTMEAGLLPWQDAQQVRGFYIGAGAMNMTPVLLDAVHADQGRLKAASEMAAAQIVTLNVRTGAHTVAFEGELRRGQGVEFPVDAPFTLFTVGAFTRDRPFEGWGIVIKPSALAAALAAPDTAAPGAEIEVRIEAQAGPGVGTDCLLLVYDARLEHESPIPKLARQIYENMREGTRGFTAGQPARGDDPRWLSSGPPRMRASRSAPAGMAMDTLAAPRMISAMPPPAPQAMMAAAPAYGMPAQTESIMTMVVAPTRMEFPELAYVEFFELRDKATRTVKLGDQIGAWRVRAYVHQGVDYAELTHDVQADKPLYAELDLPVIASQGDEIIASVNYRTEDTATLTIATPFEQKQIRVRGNGSKTFAVKGPGRFEARIENTRGTDWMVREVHRPGKQQVTASRIAILDAGQTVRGDKVVVYDSPGQVLKETINALIHYPFG